MASDFHTHKTAIGIPALISSPVPLPGKLASLEIHPWYLPEIFDRKFLPADGLLQNFAALGEIGLDKIRGPQTGIQQQYFHSLLALATDCRKPVVIHCVKAFQELFAALKHFPDVKIMFHGFNSSAEMLDELWKRNFTVSFSLSATGKPALMNKIIHAAGAFGFESDNDPANDVCEILDRMKNTLNITDIERLTDQHFADFLEI